MNSKVTNYEPPIVRVQLIRDQPLISEKQISNTKDASEVVIELVADSFWASRELIISSLAEELTVSMVL